MPPRVPRNTSSSVSRNQFPGLRADISAIVKEEGYTPLNRSAETVFNEIKYEPFFHPPTGYRSGPPVGTPGQFVCKYHNVYGHCTNRCPALIDTLEDLVQQGRLNGYVRRDEEERRRDGQDRRRDPLPPPPKPYVRRQVHMIISSDEDRVSNRTGRNIIHASRAGHLPVMTVKKEGRAGDAPITFSPTDIRLLNIPHEDALVCSVEIGDYLVHRMFVDTESAVNIIYKKTLEETGLEAKVRPAGGPVYGFSGDAVMPWGVVDLPLTLGSVSSRRTMMMEFLVMDLPNVVYNGILGRPVLNSFRAVVSMYYLKLKFPVPGGFGEVYGNQTSAKGSYVKAITQARSGKSGPGRPRKECGKKRKHEEVGATPRIGNGKEKIDSEPVDVERMPLVVPGEQCTNIELVSGKEGCTTRIGASLSPEIREELIACLRRNVDVFAFSTADLKGIDPQVAGHHLNVDPGVKPVKQRVRQFGAEKDVVIKKQVEELLKAGHIVQVKYPEWLANPVMVTKKEGTWRMCIDFTDLNKACPKDHYPLPRIDQLIDSTSGCELLSMMDAYQGYYQIKINKTDIPKTTFTTTGGVFGFVNMPFGLKNAGATYQRMMDLVFKDQIGKTMVVYVDDMLVNSAKDLAH